MKLLECLEDGAGTCLNADVFEDMERRVEAAEAEVKRLREALSDVTDGQSAHDLVYNTGLDVDRCAEILAMVRDN